LLGQQFPRSNRTWEELPRAQPPSCDPTIGFSETTGAPTHDAALGSQNSAPAVGGFSLGAKFVGLTAALILLLSLTAFMALRNSAETVRQIGSVVEFAIPAYARACRRGTWAGDPRSRVGMRT
jgi:hypothetical protein